MESITNEQKAKHLASREMYGGFTLAEQNAAYQAAMEAMEWKEQQLIDKAAEWFSYRFPNISKEAFEKFKEDMKGE